MKAFTSHNIRRALYAAALLLLLMAVALSASSCEEGKQPASSNQTPGEPTISGTPTVSSSETETIVSSLEVTTEAPNPITETLIPTTETPIPPHDHIYGEWIVESAPTCEENGAESRACTICGHKETNRISPTGHTLKITPAVPVTCTTNGKTEGITCVVCGKNIQISDTILALGHTYGEPTFIWKQNGIVSVVLHCSVCGEESPLDVTLTNEITKEPTCTEEGKITYTASVTVAGKTYTETSKQTLSVSEHNYQDGRCTICGIIDPMNVAPPVNTPEWAQWLSEFGRDSIDYRKKELTKSEFFDTSPGEGYTACPWEIWGEPRCFHFLIQFPTSEFKIASTNLVWHIWYKDADTDEPFQECITSPKSMYNWGGTKPSWYIFRVPTYAGGMTDLHTDNGEPNRYEFIIAIFDNTKLICWADVFPEVTNAYEYYLHEALNNGYLLG